LQIDEPFLAGYPEDAVVAVEAINIVTKVVDVTWGLHVCYGNCYAWPSWEGHYGFLFPAVLDAHVDQLILEFARKGYEDLKMIQRFGWDRVIGLGVVDVKTEQVESADTVAQRIRKVLDTFPADRLIINPDCGLRHLPADIVRSKLAAMVEGTATVRSTLPAEHPVASTEKPVTTEPLGTSSEPAVEQGA
jgi:5-methyltetrahydropteroyltriglutamate--homocysteine methyltransferase